MFWKFGVVWKQLFQKAGKRNVAPSDGEMTVGSDQLSRTSSCGPWLPFLRIWKCSYESTMVPFLASSFSAVTLASWLKQGLT